MNSLPEVLKAPDIATFLNVSKRFAYSMMERNDFPTIKIGRSKRVMRDDFLNWVEKQKGA
jgi:excisionase family DNA binding protein